jgi:hypothetical protein
MTDCLLNIECQMITKVFADSKIIWQKKGFINNDILNSNGQQYIQGQ